MHIMLTGVGHTDTVDHRQILTTQTVDFTDLVQTGVDNAA